MNESLTLEKHIPKVSVLVPAYNAMEYLPETISSVLSQTYQNFEIIIVNDGSSDHIENWFEQLLDQRIRLVSQSNQGLASARNTGLAEARGEYIAFIDADDLWLPTKLERQVSVLDSSPDIGLVYTWIDLIDEDGKPLGKVRKNRARGNVWLDLTVHNIVECGSVALVRRICFEKVGNFDSTLPFSCSEDWDMWLRIAAHYSFEVVQEPLVRYRYHSTNLSSRWQAMDESFQIVLGKAFKDAPKVLQAYEARSYGFAKLRAAWKALQNSEDSCQSAIFLLQEAINYYPRIKISREYIRFRSALLIVQIFGIQNYNKFRQVAYQLTDKTRKLLRKRKASYM